MATLSQASMGESWQGHHSAHIATHAVLDHGGVAAQNGLTPLYTSIGKPGVEGIKAVSD